VSAPRNVLFLCTGNSARSLMAEAILNRIGPPRFHAYSAGSHPKGSVHPEAHRLLEALGFDTSDLHSKSWNVFSAGVAFERVITVCGNAASEVCPIIPAMPAKIHWDIPDPASVTGTPSEIAAAFRETYELLSVRIRDFIQS
jgi:protein-tyrosine-phosphatase